MARAVEEALRLEQKQQREAEELVRGSRTMMLSFMSCLGGSTTLGVLRSTRGCRSAEARPLSGEGLPQD